MKIIISPAKKMEECSDMFEPGGFPVFLDRTKRLHERLCSMSEEELKELFKACLLYTSALIASDHHYRRHPYRYLHRNGGRSCGDPLRCPFRHHLP